MEPCFDEPLYNEVLGIMNEFLQPDQNYSPMTQALTNECYYSNCSDPEMLGFVNQLFLDIMNILVVFF